MSIAINADVLAKAMKAAGEIVASSSVIPILANVRLMADGDELEIVTSDLDIEYRQRLPLAAGGALSTTVAARRLSALASAAEGGAQIRMELADGRLTVKSGRSRWTLPALPSGDFPVMPEDTLCAPVALPAKAFGEALQRVLWSACTEPAKPYINSVLIHGQDGRWKLAATNGHTLMTTPVEAVWPADAEGMNVPTKLARTLRQLAGDAGTIDLSWDQRKLRAVKGDVTLTGKLIDQQFPDYTRVIPPDSHMSVVDPATLRAAIRRVALIAPEKTRSIRLDRSVHKFTIACVSPDHGSASEELPADYTGPDEATGFNAQYLAEMIDAIGGDSIAIHQQDGRAPARFTRVVSDGAVGVVMPMRI